MNETKYYKSASDKAMTTKDYDKKYVKSIAVGDVIAAAHQQNNAGRANGLCPVNLLNVTHGIKQSGQLIPVTVSKLDNGMWELMDGGHRHRALQDLNKAHPKDKRFQTIKCVEKNYTDVKDQIWWGLADNVRCAKPGTDTDTTVRVWELISTHKALGTNIESITEKDIKNYIIDGFKSRGATTPHGNSLNCMARKIFKLKSKASTRYNSPVNDGEVVDAFNQNNPWDIYLPADQLNARTGKYNWGTVTKDKNGQRWAVYNCPQATWMRQNVTHYALKKTEESFGTEDDVKVMVVGYNQNLTVGDSGCPVAKYRESIGKLAADWNAHPRIVGDLVDKVVFLPQVLATEDMKCLYSSDGKKVETIN